MIWIFESVTRPALCAGLLLCLFSSSALAEIVKQSSSGICHPPESSYYSSTQNFTAFSSVKTCLNSGGRLPKSLKTNQQNMAHENDSYAREKFGQGWSDDDGDCQNARMEALINLSTNRIRFAGDKECRVVAGKWISPFTGNVIHDASKLDVDHVVPLKWSWDRGANKWSRDERTAFANDLRNLWPVELSLNREKGARGPDEWLPPSGRCQYVARFMRILKIYKLTPSANERQKLQATLEHACS